MPMRNEEERVAIVILIVHLRGHFSVSDHQASISEGETRSDPMQEVQLRDLDFGQQIMVDEHQDIDT
ncbi:hypothetical protein LINPERPRIM_LOCUS18028 [Linum perenne]